MKMLLDLPIFLIVLLFDAIYFMALKSAKTFVYFALVSMVFISVFVAFGIIPKGAL